MLWTFLTGRSIESNLSLLLYLVPEITNFHFSVSHSTKSMVTFTVKVSKKNNSKVKRINRVKIATHWAQIYPSNMPLIFRVNFVHSLKK